VFVLEKQWKARLCFGPLAWTPWLYYNMILLWMLSMDACGCFNKYVKGFCEH